MDNNEHNLPLDADDLSRHASALFRLKGTETGFVVPENYFEESAERMVAVSMLQSDEQSGFVVPEPYFDELPSLIEAKTALPAETGLAAPDNYFEGLNDRLEAQLTLESSLPKTQDDVPQGYFDQMESELHVHIALDNIHQEEGLEVPQGYFGDLTQRILNNTSLSADVVNDDQVPEGYFDALPEKVIARINFDQPQERGRVRVLSWTREHVRIISVAASVALLIVFGWIFVNHAPEGSGALRVADNYKTLTPERVPDVAPVSPESPTNNSETAVVAVGIPKKREEIKPKQVQPVLMNEDELSAQLGQMDESLVIEFVTESEVLEPTEEVLNAEMMEYLMNDNTGLEVFDPGDK